eukprot:TRINITY_DN861_c0_g1_i3.p3 TRINITY_DN861_c0_g1~~TRINITY_DN861_c0_g1_i3.p3  ORF type:complete len:273 (-),score=43.40 TRINITY_DN861_c0_g1_i3:4412-5230(-)
MSFLQQQPSDVSSLPALLANLQLQGYNIGDSMVSSPFTSVAPSIPIPTPAMPAPACPIFPGTDSPVSHLDVNALDMNTVQQLVLMQQAGGMQQVMAGMLAQYQSTQVAAQTQAMLSLLIPLVNLQQEQGVQGVQGDKPTKAVTPKKDTKEKFKKPGNKQYKTEMCKTFEETGSCRYGKKCQFAHGGVDMRNSPKHPKFKTIPCETIVNGGSCPYGRRCRFIHPTDPEGTAEMFSCSSVCSERRLPVFEELAPSTSSHSLNEDELETLMSVSN